AKVAASLNYRSERGFEDAKGRWIPGEPGDASAVDGPRYEHQAFPKPGAGPANDKAKEDEAALAQDLVERLALEQRLPPEQPLPEAAPLPTAPRLPGEDDHNNRERRRRR